MNHSSVTPADCERRGRSTGKKRGKKEPHLSARRAQLPINFLFFLIRLFILEVHD